MTWRRPDMSRDEREAVAAILALGDASREPLYCHYPRRPIDTPAVAPGVEKPEARRSKDEQGLIWGTEKGRDR